MTTGPDLSRSSLGTIGPGNYRICSSPLFNLHPSLEKITDQEKRPPKKKIKLSAASGSEASNRPDDGPEGFKMRLVRHDKSCVVCSSPYKYFGDSSYFHGAHIFPFEMQELWKSRELSANMCDPFTAATPGNETRNKCDPLRINSLDNGLLLCLAYDEYQFAIHPGVNISSPQ
ncbi:hypothetical protein EI94DRAFT_1725568 [Lactarius quietus]|nr:hypothetical protein EI94DRAFT_1725568 [Lactarius quietus]